jgi:fatty-acyl-CoA synthase
VSSTAGNGRSRPAAVTARTRCHTWAMKSTMQDYPLLISDILRHGKQVHGDSTVITVEAAGHRSATFTEVAERAEKLAAALARLGIQDGDRVGTFCWNNQGHLEAYLAIPSMGAVLHTLNIRLPAEQLTYIINHAEDRFIIVDTSLIPLLAAIKDDLKTVETIIVAGEGDTSPLGETLSYERLLAAEEPGYEWPVLDERSAAAMCYTSGTTGSPKGVVYSHRSTWLHTMAEQAASSVGMTESDRILIIVPMFHANAWGTPYAAFMAGTDIIMPQMFLMGEQLAKVINEFHPTLACGVPTIWNGLLALDTKIDFSTVRGITAGGAAVPESLIRAFEERFGATIIQGWGMTETSPLAAFGLPPARKLDGHDDMYYKVKAGRVVGGVEVRVVAEDGTVLPNDGKSVGEFEIRGPWITGSYYQDEDPTKFHDGWLRTGDVGTQDTQGYLTISDRTKDVIKSGGEWISSVELENAVMAHPDVFEAAVIAVPDPKWSERPLVAVVPKPGRTPAPADLVAFLKDRVPRWWLPEQWIFIDEVPKTSVGKFDKKVMRAAYADGAYEVQHTPLPK